MFKKLIKKKSWKDVKLRQAQELLQLEEKTGLDLLISQMAIILDTDEGTIEDLPMTEITKFAEEWSFLNMDPVKKLTKTFKVGDTRFGMVELNELTLAQVIDIEEYWSQGWIENLHKILSCLFLPVKSYNRFTKKYELEKYKPKPKPNHFEDICVGVLLATLILFALFG